MTHRIIIEDDKLFTVQAFLNVIPDSDFVKTLRNLTNGIGATFNDICCLFPEDLDPWDEPFEGICFSVLNEEIVISKEEFSKYLRNAAMTYAHKYPDKEIEILQLLNEFDQFTKDV